MRRLLRARQWVSSWCRGAKRAEVGGRSDEEAVRRASASLRSWTGRGEWERTFVEDGVEQGLLRLARGARRWREKGREEVDRCHLRVRVLLGELDGLLQRLCRCFGELVHVGYWR